MVVLDNINIIRMNHMDTLWSRKSRSFLFMQYQLRIGIGSGENTRSDHSWDNINKFYSFSESLYYANIIQRWTELRVGSNGNKYKKRQWTIVWDLREEFDLNESDRIALV